MHSKIFLVALTVNKYIHNFDPKDECTAKLIFSLDRNYSCLTTPVSKAQFGQGASEGRAYPHQQQWPQTEMPAVMKSNGVWRHY